MIGSIRNYLKATAVIAVVTTCLVLAGIVRPAFAQSLYSEGTIGSIAIEGNQRFSDAKVLAIVPVAVGQSFDPVVIDATIKNLFATGEFSDVRVGRNGDQLVINVLENLVLDIVAFEGNEALDDELLAQVVQSRPRDPFTKTRVQNDIRRMLRAYEARGLFNVNISPKLITLERNRANLVFEIFEGTAAKIDSIVFIGNRAFTDGTLRGALQSRQRAPWRLFSQVDVYNSDRLAVDAQLLEVYYQQRGYADFRVVSTSGEQISDRSGFVVTFQVDEGRLYNFGQSNIRSEIGGFNGEDLRRLVENRTGSRYDVRDISETTRAMEEALGERGFAFGEVRVEQERDSSTGVVDVTYVIEEGRKVFVERIDINGNDVTLDYVIRREFRLTEGDAFSVSKLQRSQQRIRSLGYFSVVDVDTLPGSAADRTIIDVTVEEDSSNEFKLGGTLSTQSGILGDLGVKFGNIGGRGQSFSVNLSGSQTQQSFNMSFSEPWLFDREIPASAAVFYNQDISPTASYNSRSLGGRVSLGYKLSEEVAQRWSYTLRRSEIFNVDAAAPFIITQDEGVAWRSILGHSVSYDTRDNPNNPREGLLLTMSNDIAGLGGDVAYLQNIVAANYYIPVFEESSFAFRAEAGNIIGLGQDTRISDRYFLGETLVRGFSPDGLTPRCDSANSNGACTSDVTLGGNTYYRGTAEFRFPFPIVGEQGFSGRVFADVGAVFGIGADTGAIQVLQSAEPRFSMGVGATWNSPFGPLSVDYGIPFNVQEGDEIQNVRFSISGNF